MVRVAGIEPGTSALEVWRATNKPPHHTYCFRSNKRKQNINNKNRVRRGWEDESCSVEAREARDWVMDSGERLTASLGTSHNRFSHFSIPILALYSVYTVYSIYMLADFSIILKVPP